MKRRKSKEDKESYLSKFPSFVYALKFRQTGFIFYHQGSNFYQTGICNKSTMIGKMYFHFPINEFYVKFIYSYIKDEDWFKESLEEVMKQILQVVKEGKFKTIKLHTRHIPISLLSDMVIKEGWNIEKGFITYDLVREEEES